MVDKNGKVFSCPFSPDILCLYRKNERFSMMSRCSKCRHLRRFEREMDEEDERVMKEIDEERKYLERGLRGESR